jgi:hypothetical protein
MTGLDPTISSGAVFHVMAGLDPAISISEVAGSDGRVKPGHDGWRL